VQNDLKNLGLILHSRLLKGKDTQVTAEIAEIFLPILVNDLYTKFPNFLDPHQLETIAEDSLLRYFAHPEKYDPAKSNLIGYLYMDAYWDVRNLLQQQKKVVALEAPISEHEMYAVRDEADPEAILSQKESQQFQFESPLIKRVLTLVSRPRDRQVLELMMEGVRETQAYAQVLGIQSRLPEEQAKIVKQHKDRLKKTIQRKVRKAPKR
jgi:hypothetical protein